MSETIQQKRQRNKKNQWLETRSVITIRQIETTNFFKFVSSVKPTVNKDGDEQSYKCKKNQLKL